MYKQYKTLSGEIATGIKFIGENIEMFIPANPDNTDYQQYLKWVEAGNTPISADGE